MHSPQNNSVKHIPLLVFASIQAPCTQECEHAWADGVGQLYGSEVGQSPVIGEDCLERWTLKPNENQHEGEIAKLRDMVVVEVL
jgi:hypothetical protein